MTGGNEEEIPMTGGNEEEIPVITANSKRYLKAGER
jgi:hypothetical protein